MCFMLLGIKANRPARMVPQEEFIEMRTLREEIIQAAYEAGEIMNSAPLMVRQANSKEGHANFVTEYDRRVQEYLQSKLLSILPEAHFVGEENGREVFLPEYEHGFTYVVDPIDGTSNFMKAYRPSVTSIGVLKEGRPYVGVVYNPYSDQMFSAEAGCGAYENGERFFSSGEPLSASLAAMGTAPYYEDAVRKSAFQMGYWYLQRCIDIRRSGSAAWDLCMVAAGHLGLFFEPKLCLWDFAAGACILQEAGGCITDLYGNKLSYRNASSIVAVSQGVMKDDYLPPEELIVTPE